MITLGARLEARTSSKNQPISCALPRPQPRTRVTRAGPGQQARSPPTLRLPPEATAAAAAPGDTQAPSEREGCPGCSSRSRGQGATAADANMRSRQVKLEVLARELCLGELEELLRRPLVGEDCLEHQVRKQPILRTRAVLLPPAVAVRSFWAEAAAAHRGSDPNKARRLQRVLRSVLKLLPDRERQTCARCSDQLCNQSAPFSSLSHRRPQEFPPPPRLNVPLECRAARYAAYWRSAPAAPPSGGRRLLRT